jgi:SAM-dependent methyltransferase
LAPKEGMYYLDAGCCANLANYRLDGWPSVYHGVDISPALIGAMKSFVEKKRILIGGLYNTDIANMPFHNEYFDIASAIGVLEYCTLEYTEQGLDELARVLKPGAKIVLDIPNLEHPHVGTMFSLEEYYGRPNIPKERGVFESLLQRAFTPDRVDDSLVMLKYFVRKR